MNSSKGKMMTTFRKRLLVGMVALGLGAGSFAAYADKPDCGPMGGRAPYGEHGMSGERMKERMEKRLTELHDKLKLNATQENAWRTYVTKVKPTDFPARPDRAELDKLTAPERMERMHSLMQAGEKRMAEHVAATKEFYAVLTPEQQKIFNEQFQRGPGHRRGAR
jgi:periplasmic protein CpxP/Spy